MASRDLKTTLAVIETLGGMPEVGRLTGYPPKQVWNWKASGQFPAKTYLILTDALRSIGKTAPASLWGMVEPSSEHQSAA